MGARQDFKERVALMDSLQRKALTEEDGEKAFHRAMAAKVVMENAINIVNAEQVLNQQSLQNAQEGLVGQ